MMIPSSNFLNVNKFDWTTSIASLTTNQVYYNPIPWSLFIHSRSYVSLIGQGHVKVVQGHNRTFIDLFSLVFRTFLLRHSTILWGRNVPSTDSLAERSFFFFFFSKKKRNNTPNENNIDHDDDDDVFGTSTKCFVVPWKCIPLTVLSM